MVDQPDGSVKRVRYFQAFHKKPKNPDRNAKTE